MTHQADNLAGALDERRQALGMSIRILSRKCHLSPCTVQKALSGSRRERIDTLLTIAQALGLTVQIKPAQSVESFRKSAAKSKAERIVNRTQGNFALEGQAVPAAAQRRIENRIAKKLLTGPRIRLWS
jgi:transcriptional regulator with XRE-family HTH domain